MRGSAPTGAGSTTRQILDGFLPIHVQSLRINTVLSFDLYLYASGEMILYRASHMPFTVKMRDSLADNGVRRLHVSVENRRDYQKYVKSHIERILSDPELDDFTKSSIVYDSAKEMIAEVMNDPSKGENIADCQAIVESTVLYVLDTPNVFHNMVRVMSFDYTLYSHSVNVSTFALALAGAAGVDSTQTLIELGTGAMLHDVGKVKVSNAILHKRGPLTEEEMQQIRRHPNWGAELVHETNLIPDASYIPIKQHHEREDGSGYPDGIVTKDIHLFGKIVAIADMFDAMTTERVYRNALNSFSALRAMYDEQHRLDGQLLDLFVQLMGPTERFG